MLLLFQATQAADSVQVAADELMKEAIANAEGLDKLSLITQQLIDFGIRAGERILIAVIVFIVGRFLISMLNKFAATRHTQNSMPSNMNDTDTVLLFFISPVFYVVF